MRPGLRKPLFSITINIFRSRGDLPVFMDELEAFAERERARFEVEAVFVIDGSPDDSLDYLRERLPSCDFRWKLINLARNFGATFAMRCAIANATGDYCAPLPPDLQESFDLISRAFDVLSKGEADICVGQREKKEDPLSSRLFSGLFWMLYRRFIQKDVPKGGIDFFAYNAHVRSELVKIRDQGSFFVGHLLALGFRRHLLPYRKQARKQGASSWSLAKKLRYSLDSLFGFSTLPIKLLLFIGVSGMCAAVALSGLTIYYRFVEQITVPGYSKTIVMICFFGGINSFGLGILGEYLWRIYNNTLERPLYTILDQAESREPTTTSRRKRSHG